jgi:hypothetical protein
MIGDGSEPRRLRRAAGIFAVGLLIAIGMISVPAASASPIGVSSCQTLASPGAYALTSDVTAVDSTCIDITASDVTLDLAGHTMTCTGSGFEGSCQVPGRSPRTASTSRPI